jgi:hypothetical protein
MVTREHLTFDINGEIIVCVERLAVSPQAPALSSRFRARIHSSFIHIAGRVSFRNSLEGG